MAILPVLSTHCYTLSVCFSYVFRNFYGSRCVYTRTHKRLFQDVKMGFVNTNGIVVVSEGSIKKRDRKRALVINQTEDAVVKTRWLFLVVLLDQRQPYQYNLLPFSFNSRVYVKRKMKKILHFFYFIFILL